MRTSEFQISYSLSSIANAAHQFWQFAHTYKLIAWEGEMGAGKTTFCAALAKAIGVQESLSSPTYALMNEYDLPNNEDGFLWLAHMDWFRLQNEEEAIAAGMENILTNENYRCWIEWWTQAPHLLTKPFVAVNIEMGEKIDERKLSATIIT